MSALNGAQDISIRVVSCREVSYNIHLVAISKKMSEKVVQETILRGDNNISPQASTALAELMVCSLMMGSALKGS